MEKKIKINNFLKKYNKRTLETNDNKVIDYIYKLYFKDRECEELNKEILYYYGLYYKINVFYKNYDNKEQIYLHKNEQICKMLSYFKTAVACGDKKSMNELAEYYKNINNEKALIYSKKSVNEGKKDKIEEGKGLMNIVKLKYEKSENRYYRKKRIEYYKKAAKKNNIEAIDKLHRIYTNKNERRKAKKYYIKLKKIMNN